MKKPLILISNDDGIEAPGIRALEESVREFGEVVVIAPAEEQSAKSHSITVRRPIRVERLAPNRIAIHGTPADCVLLAMRGFLDSKPDIVISGVNYGLNLGSDVVYSGTVAAAREAAIMGVPAFAVSIDVFSGTPIHWETATHFARKLLKLWLDREIEFNLLNINVPNLPLDEIKGVRCVRLGNMRYKNPIEQLDESTFMIKGEPIRDMTEDTDVCAVYSGYVSCTPIVMELTDFKWLEKYDGRISL